MLFVAFQTKLLTLDEVLGGDQVRPFELFHYLAEAGHHVHIWETDNPGAEERHLYDSRLIVRQLKAGTDVLTAFSQLSEMKQVLRTERDWATSEGIDTVVYYQQVPVGIVFRWRTVPLPTQMGVFAIDTAAALGMCTWGAVHDICPEHEMLQRARSRSHRKGLFSWFRDALRGRIGMCLQKKYFERVGFLSTVSPPLLEEISRRYGRGKQAIGLFLSGCNPRLVEEISEWQPPSSDTSWTIGYLGSPHDVALELIVQSVVEVDNPRVRLLLSGRGMQENIDPVRSLWPSVTIKEGVRYANYAEIAEEVDIWVIPYADRYLLDFAWQLKLPMAFASGRPVVLSAGRCLESVGLKECVFATGSTVPEISATISEVIADPAEAKRRSSAARALALADHTWSRRCESVLAAFHQTISLR